MSQYQIYMLNGLGEIIGDSVAECASDEEACFTAEVMLKPGALAEVWTGARRIGIVHDTVTTMH